MKKLLNLLLFLSFLFGYLEWSGGSHGFVFQLEAELFRKAAGNPLSVSHPLILIPLAGQLMLLYTLFQPQPGRWPTLIALASLSILPLFLLLIGLISANTRITLSTLPFLITGLFVLRFYYKK